MGRHFDAKGRHGGQNCFERRQLLRMALVETALKTFDRRQGRRPKQTSICLGFDGRFYRRSKVFTAVSTSVQRF